MPKYERIEEGWGFAAVLILNGRFITNTKFCNSKKKKDENISAFFAQGKREKIRERPTCEGPFKIPPVAEERNSKAKLVKCCLLYPLDGVSCTEALGECHNVHVYSLLTHYRWE